MHLNQNTVCLGVKKPTPLETFIYALHILILVIQWIAYSACRGFDSHSGALQMSFMTTSSFEWLKKCIIKVHVTVNLPKEAKIPLL